MPGLRARCGRLLRPASRARGVTLVEALVALVVLSVGMLGIAGLFVHSVRNSRSALLRTQAVNLVADMTDRIRANASAGAAYDLAGYGDAPTLRDCAPTSGGSGANCSIDELAEDDLARWQAAVQSTLPSIGDAPPATEVEYIEPDAPGQPERYRVAVSWGEPGDSGRDGGPQLFRYESSVIVMPRPPVS